MGVKLNDPGEKPGVSTEALLRALGVNQPSLGLDWEALARLVVVAADYSGATAEPTYPEGYWGSGVVGTLGPDGANTWSGYEMVAGPRGFWWRCRWGTTTGGNLVAGIFIQEERPAWFTDNAGPFSAPLTIGGFTDNDAVVSGGFIDNTAPGAGQPAAEFNVNEPNAYWVPPGHRLYLISQSQNIAMQVDGIIARAPLATP